MTPEMRGGSNGNGPSKPPLEPIDFYEQSLERAEGDLSDAVGSIETVEDALNFALGVAERLSKESGYNENGSAAAASAEIILALSRAMGPGTPGYDSRAYRERLALWQEPLGIMKTAQNTPGMWRCLLRKEDFGPISERDGVPYSPERFRAAADLFYRATVQLEHAAA